MSAALLDALRAIDAADLTPEETYLAQVHAMVANYNARVAEVGGSAVPLMPLPPTVALSAPTVGRAAVSKPASKAKPAQSRPTEQARTRPAYTLNQAANMTGASRSTLRRRLAEQAFPNAYRAGKTGEWRVPVEDLLAVGLRVNAPTPPESMLTEQPTAGVSAAPDAATAARVAELERLLAVEQARREAAEQLAAERAERVEDLRASLRMLEAGPVGRAQQAEQGERRGWFGRRRPE